MAQYTRTAAGGFVKGGKKAARRLHMKGPRRDGTSSVPKKKDNDRHHHAYGAPATYNRFGGFGSRF